MTETALQFALRETRDVATDPRALAVVGVLALVMGLSGPFQTFELMPLLPRLAYWCTIAVFTSLAGVFFGTLAMESVRRRLAFTPLMVAAGGIGAGVPVALVVAAVSFIAFGGEVFNFFSFGVLLAYCVPISTGVSLIFAVLGLSRPHGQRGDPDAATVRVAPKILERLPLPERGELVSLSVNDHYVDIVTSKGRSMLLMRLSDAIGETEGVAGVQIHRSHWVALEGVAKVHRAGGKVTVETSTGDRLPVSRGFLPAVRAAGLVT